MNKVLLVFTTYNKLSMTKECLSYAEKLGHDILVIDDCSTDDTFDYIRGRCSFILKPKRKGLTDSWNSAYYWFKESDYTHMILCNNDVLIPKGAVEGMLSDYPLVVPMCNESGTGYVCKEQSYDKWYKQGLGGPEDKKDIHEAWKNHKVFTKAKCWTGFCMCFSRAIIEYERDDGNLFDPANINVGNDDDLAKRIPAMIALGAFVYHRKGVSFNKQIGGRDDLRRTY